MKILLISAIAVFATPGVAKDIIVSPGASAGYELLAAGRNGDAIDLLREETSEPSRLINLGTAYARMGQRSEAVAAYTRAMRSDDRYDVELADGRSMDSRAAARRALSLMQTGQTTLAAR